MGLSMLEEENVVTDSKDN